MKDGRALIEWNREALEAAGFSGWVPFVELKEIRPPGQPGVYVVTRPIPTAVEFLAISIGGWFKGLDPAVSPEVLKAAWVEGATVLYIGKATNLRARLGQYRRYGEGKPVGHQGGRYIWQLTDSSELLVAWRETPDEAPNIVESRLIARFSEAHGGRRPFANLKN